MKSIWDEIEIIANVFYYFSMFFNVSSYEIFSVLFFHFDILIYKNKIISKWCHSISYMLLKKSKLSFKLGSSIAGGSIAQYYHHTKASRIIRMKTFRDQNKNCLICFLAK